MTETASSLDLVVSPMVPCICNRLIENRLLVIGFLPLAFICINPFRISHLHVQKVHIGERKFEPENQQEVTK